jgi:hypothetical protein
LLALFLAFAVATLTGRASTLALILSGVIVRGLCSSIAAALLHQLTAARDDRRLLKLQRELQTPRIGQRVLGSERLTGAPLDRLTHHVHILTMNGDKQSAGRRRAATSTNTAGQNQAIAEADNQVDAPAVDPAIV